MGSCKTLLERSSLSYGALHQSICCRAASARSPVTTYPEGNTCKARALTSQRQLQTRHQSDLIQQENHRYHAGQPEGMPSGSADVPDGAPVEKLGISNSQPAAVLLPPPRDALPYEGAPTFGCEHGLPCGNSLSAHHLSSQQPQKHQGEQQQPMHRDPPREHYLPQLARGPKRARISANRPTAPPDSLQQQQDAQSQQHPSGFSVQHNGGPYGIAGHAAVSNPVHKPAALPLVQAVQGAGVRADEAATSAAAAGSGLDSDANHYFTSFHGRGRPQHLDRSRQQGSGKRQQEQQTRQLQQEVVPSEWHSPQQQAQLLHVPEPTQPVDAREGPTVPPYLDHALRSAGEASTSGFGTPSAIGGAHTGSCASHRTASRGRRRSKTAAAARGGGRMAAAAASTWPAAAAAAASAAAATAAVVSTPGGFSECSSSLAARTGSHPDTACNNSSTRSTNNSINNSSSSSNSSESGRIGIDNTNQSSKSGSGDSNSSRDSSSTNGRGGRTARSRRRASDNISIGGGGSGGLGDDGLADAGTRVPSSSPPPLPPPPGIGPAAVTAASTLLTGTSAAITRSSPPLAAAGPTAPSAPPPSRPAASDPDESDPDEPPSPAVRLGKGGVRYRADGWRIPRSPSPEEHARRRLQAEQARAALRHRAPTPPDLRLTRRVMGALHWREILDLLFEHVEAHERCMQARQAAQVVHLPPQPQLPQQPQPQPLLGRSQHVQDEEQQHSQHSPEALPQEPSRPQPYGTPLTAAATSRHMAASQLPLSALALTPQHVAAMLARTATLVAAAGRPGWPAEARQLHALVERLAGWGAGMLGSPDMGLREVATIFHALVRLRHPLRKPYFIRLMEAARRRFTARLSPASPPRASATSASSPASGANGGGSRGRGGGSSKRCRSASRGATPNSNNSGPVQRPLPYNALDMSQLMWSVANCGMEGLRVDWAQAYGKALLPVVQDMTPHSVSVVLSGMAKLQSPPQPEVLEALCMRLVTLTGNDLGHGGYDKGTMRQPSPPPPPQQQQQQGGEAGNGGEQEHQSRQQHGATHGQSYWQTHSQEVSDDAAAATLAAEAVAAATEAGAAAAADAEPTTTATDHDVEQALAAAAKPCGYLCRPADVSLSLWALATLRLPVSTSCPQLLPAAELYSQHRMQDFSPQELSNLIWAFAKLQYKPGPAWEHRLYDAVRKLLYDLQPQAIAILLYSTATLGLRPSDEWLQAVLRCVKWQLRCFAPQALALTMHAVASLGYRPHVSWMAAFHSHLEAQEHLDSRVLDKVREAYRMLGYRPGSPSGSHGNAGQASAPTRAARSSQAALPPAAELRVGPMGRSGQTNAPERRDAPGVLERVGVERGSVVAEEAAGSVLIRPSRFI